MYLKFLRHDLINVSKRERYRTLMSLKVIYVTFTSAFGMTAADVCNGCHILENFGIHSIDDYCSAGMLPLYRQCLR